MFDMDGTLFPELNPAYFSDYLLAHRILTDPSYEPDDEMLEYGRLLRDHMLDGDAKAKQERHDCVFPEEMKKAYEMGKALV